MSEIGAVGGVSLPTNAQSLLDVLVKTEQDVVATITAIATGQKADNPGLGLVVDLSV